MLKDAATLAEPAGLGDRVNMVFDGTAVTRGRGRAVVTATGMGTEMGNVARLLGETEEERTPLQREVDRIGRMLGIAVIVIAVVVVAAILLTADIEEANDLVDVLLVGVSLAVAAVPEGLPAVLSVVLALGVQRMARQRAIVKKLSSVETLGVCIGRLLGQDRHADEERDDDREGRSPPPATSTSPARATARSASSASTVTPLDDPVVLDEVRFVLGGGGLANDAVLRQDDDDWSVQGDPTRPRSSSPKRRSASPKRGESRFQRVGEVPFTSERKLMTTLEADVEREGRIAVVTKGAPDVLLSRCTHERVAGDVRPLTDDRRGRGAGHGRPSRRHGLRTLAVAYRPLPDVEPPAQDESIERELIYLGMVGIIDPPRPEARAAIAEAEPPASASIMITGDHPRTAARIAAELGIVDAGRGGDHRGARSRRSTTTPCAPPCATSSVYARVAPEHKLRIVDALQANGNIVAMTGDGVNDAPALKSADIGVAMGITGTDVTKEAGDMILADDNFATIVAAVREGRAIFANIRKFLRFLLSSNIGEVLTMFLGVVFAGVIGLDATGEAIAVPLLATQILWINLLTDTAPGAGDGRRPAARRRHGASATTAHRPGHRRRDVGRHRLGRAGHGDRHA